MVFAKDIVVHGEKTDRYGRMVGRIQLGEKDVNLEQLRLGMAWHYKEYESAQSALERNLYRDAEDKARQAKIALWKDALPVPPWSFRRQARATSAAF